MKYGKRFLSVVLTLVLCLSVLSSTPAKAADAFFTAIDESILKLTDETMPIWSGGVLYAPYTTFNRTENGISGWTIQASYSKNGSRVAVFDRTRFLEFDLKTGTCWDDLTGIAYSGGAILRGGRPYLPVSIVCEHFDLTYSYREIQQGSLLRIKTEEVVIPDSRFADAAENILNHRLKEYTQSQPGNNPPAGTTVPQPPSPVIPPENDQNVDTYLAFRCENAEQMEAVLSVMDSARAKGMFFLTEELIVQRADLVMRILGSGSSVGLLAEGEGIEEIREVLSDGRKALAEQAFCTTTVAFVPQEFRETLEQEGWICWNSTLDLTPEDTSGANYFARRVLSQLGNRTRDTYLSFDISANTVRILPTLLINLDDKGFELELPLETRL
jgi:hypothetical protein